MSLISYLTRIHFADRVLEDGLPEEIVRNRISRPLVISGQEEGDADGADRLIDALPVSVTPVHFSTRQSTSAIGERQRASDLLTGGEIDGIVGFGGRQPLDLARMLGDAEIPVIAVPTTTETVGLGPLGIDRDSRSALRGRIPNAILCDPTLTVASGLAATAAAGMSALVHCLESFLSTAYNPPADGMALEGLRRAWLNLGAVVDDGNDLSARREMLAAALNAGLASEKGYGGIEAAAFGLEATTKTTYGVLHGALLAEVMDFNAPAVTDRSDAIRTTLGLSSRADFVEELTMFAERIGLPTRLSDVGVAAPHLPNAALRAAADPANRTNPRHATASDYEQIMRAVL